MKLIINGQNKELPHANNLADVVTACCKVPKNIVTEVNGAIIPCGQWEQVSVKEGDTIELVSFVGGG